MVILPPALSYTALFNQAQHVSIRSSKSTPQGMNSQPPPSMVATCFASCPKNDWLFAASQYQLANPSEGARRYDSPLLAPQAPPFAAPCASCTLYVAYPACASLARKVLTSAALKAGTVGFGAALSVFVRPLLDSRLWLVRCAQKLPGC